MRSLIISFLAIAFCLTEVQSQSTLADQSSAKTQFVDFKLLAGSKNTGFGVKYRSLYAIGPLMNVGWGAGYTTHSADLEHNFVPVTFEAIGDLVATGRTFYYGVSLGYGIGLPEPETFATKTLGGLTYEMSVGFRNKSVDAAPFVALGYHTQRAKYEGVDQFGDGARAAVYKRWSISAGAFF